MKAKLIREMVSPHDPAKVTDVKFPQPPEKRNKTEWVYPIGTIIAHPTAFRLVQMGVAIPEDDACTSAANMKDAQISVAQKAYERVSKGIHPEDYDKFDRGEILGYNPDGSYIPGPNAATFDDEEPEDEEGDDEEEE